MVAYVMNASENESLQSGFIVRLEVEDFKSYRGHHVIGPLRDFTAVVGLNGSGKFTVYLWFNSTHHRTGPFPPLPPPPRQRNQYPLSYGQLPTRR